MLAYRSLWIVKYGDGRMCGFERAEEARAYARKVAGSVQQTPIYLAGKEPEPWTVYVGINDAGSVLFWDYQATEVACGPHDDKPCVVFQDEVDGHTVVRAFGTDREAVRKAVVA